MDKLERILREHRHYFQTGATRSVPSRLKTLKTLKVLLKREGDSLAEAIGKDLGRCWLEAWTSEPGLVLGDLRHVMQRLPFWNMKRPLRLSPLMIPGYASSSRKPYGTALIIGPWNYPAGLLLAPMVSALAAGNTVILKPSERAPATSALLRKIMEEYFHPGIVSVVTGGGEEARWLVRNAADIVCFTGSGSTGKKVMEDASSRPIPVILELGGANPCFVDFDANLKEAARRIAWGKFFAAGQTCLAPNHVFVHESIHKAFLHEMVMAVKDFYGEKPENSPDYGRIVDQAAWESLSSFLSMGNPVCGGYGMKEQLFIAPTVLSGVQEDSPLFSQEIFGPVLPVVPCKSVEKAMLLTGTGDFSPLTAYGFSARPSKMKKLLLRTVRAGSVTVNGTLHRIVSSSFGFGGVGGSGFGRYRGKEGYRNFTWEQVVLAKSPRFEMPMIYPPYKIGRRMVRMLGKLF